MAKQSHGISVTRNTEDMTVTFKLTDKSTEKVIDSLTIKWADVHDGCRDFTALYGLTKILQDRESGTGMMEKLQAYQDLFDDTLAQGILNRERKGGGPTVRIEVEALAAIKDMTVKQAQTLLQKYDKEDREKILASKPVTDKVAEMKADTEEVAENALDDLLS
jgi:hypothetical protein